MSALFKKKDDMRAQAAAPSDMAIVRYNETLARKARGGIVTQCIDRLCDLMDGKTVRAQEDGSVSTLDAVSMLALTMLVAVVAVNGIIGGGLASGRSLGAYAGFALLGALAFAAFLSPWGTVEMIEHAIDDCFRPQERSDGKDTADADAHREGHEMR